MNSLSLEISTLPPALLWNLIGGWKTSFLYKGPPGGFHATLIARALHILPVVCGLVPGQVVPPIHQALSEMLDATKASAKFR